MSSGIEVDSLCMDIFEEMKITKKDRPQTRKMALFRISKDCTKVVSDDSPIEGLEQSRQPADDVAMFAKLKEILNNTKDGKGSHIPMYVLFDFIFISSTGSRVEKLAFISWCPDTSGIKAKMIFASTKDALIKKFDGVACTFQISDVDDLNYEDMKKKVEKAK